MQDQAADIVEGKSQTAMQSSFLFQAFFNQPRVHQFADQRRRQKADSRRRNLLFDVPGNFRRQQIINVRFPQERIHNALAVPRRDLFAGRADKQCQICRFG